MTDQLEQKITAMQIEHKLLLGQLDRSDKEKQQLLKVIEELQIENAKLHSNLDLHKVDMESAELQLEKAKRKNIKQEKIANGLEEELMQTIQAESDYYAAADKLKSLEAKQKLLLDELAETKIAKQNCGSLQKQVAALKSEIELEKQNHRSCEEKLLLLQKEQKLKKHV